MIPVDKVSEIIKKHQSLEKELSSGAIEKKLFASKSKEYSELNAVICYAKEYLTFDKTKDDLKKIISDENNDKEIKDLAKTEIDELDKKHKKNEILLKLFMLPKDEADTKNAILEIRAGTGGLEA
ncbi:MAG: PCRF domain-containing protein, partial [Pseudomonadota bacterium]|nr:PCRF domain-containing protein [Pseudomonadota bacterium]